MAFSWEALVRLLHIVAASLWLGGGVFALTQIMPAVKVAGPPGKAFMLTVARRGGFGKFFGPASGATVLFGLILFWRYGYSKAAFASTSSILVSVGALLGLVAFVEGLAVTMPVGKRMQRLAEKVGPQGPSAEQAEQFATMVARLNGAAVRGIVMVGLAFLLMIGRTLV